MNFLEQIVQESLRGRTILLASTKWSGFEARYSRYSRFPDEPFGPFMDHFSRAA